MKYCSIEVWSWFWRNYEKKKNILTRCKTYCKRKMLLNVIKFLIIQLLIIISWMQSYCCRWSVPDWNLLCA
jgi:hypothetical protein